MSEGKALVVHSRRVQLEQQKRRLSEWLANSCEPGSTQFIVKCERIREIDLDLKELLEAHYGD